MISPSARDAIDYYVTTALKSALCASSDDQCVVESFDDPAEITEKKVVMLTVSSYIFRAITLVYFTLNAQTKRHFAAINRTDVETMGDADFLDVIGECGNIFCGALNRSLAHHYPHIGMSTPNVLDRDCVAYLGDLDASHTRHFRVTINDSFTMHASLCVCDFADMDFAADVAQAESESSGELELF